MQSPVKERVQKLREEIADLDLANRMYVHRRFHRPVETAKHEQRRQRLKEIMNEVRGMTEWKEM